MNELVLILSVIFLYSLLLLWFKLFGKIGVYCFTVFATLLANIEVLILVNAFGIEMTLGNVLFATTFIATDILSETESKEAAKKSVNIGILTSISFMILTSSWLLYTPSANDWAMPSIKAIFSSTPRVILSSLTVYAIVQRLDVWLYHKIWDYTEKKTGSRKKFLWLRNNLATITSQLVNSILYNVFAFYGTFPNNTLVTIIISTFAIAIVTSLLDTPVVYIARNIAPKDSNQNIEVK
jgi:uncharacterized integral membrane protein (TIGR00697 family)